MSYYPFHYKSVFVPNTLVRTLTVSWLLLRLELCRVRGGRPKPGSLTLNAEPTAGSPMKKKQQKKQYMFQKC